MVRSSKEQCLEAKKLITVYGLKPSQVARLTGVSEPTCYAMRALFKKECEEKHINFESVIYEKMPDDLAEKYGSIMKTSNPDEQNKQDVPKEIDPRSFMIPPIKSIIDLPPLMVPSMPLQVLPRLRTAKMSLGPVFVSDIEVIAAKIKEDFEMYGIEKVNIIISAAVPHEK